MCQRFVTRQQNKDHMGINVDNQGSLVVPERRWESIVINFIVKLTKTKTGLDFVTTYVDVLT